LYIWGRESFTLSRNNPEQIKRRFKSVALASVVSLLYVRLIWGQGHHEISFGRLVGVHTEFLLSAIFYCLSLTALLFAGPLLQMLWEKEKEEEDEPQKRPMLFAIRDLVVGPVTEEIVFRACTCPVLLVGGLSPNATIICTPIFFGLAHLHHILHHLTNKTGSELKREILLSIFQLGYTTLFGLYSAFLFVRTGHIAPVILVHTFCNYMGFPAFQQALAHKYRFVLGVVYVLGLVLFIYNLLWFTNPVYFNSILYELRLD